MALIARATTYTRLHTTCNRFPVEKIGEHRQLAVGREKDETNLFRIEWLKEPYPLDSAHAPIDHSESQMHRNVTMFRNIHKKKMNRASLCQFFVLFYFNSPPFLRVVPMNCVRFFFFFCFFSFVWLQIILANGLPFRFKMYRTYVLCNMLGFRNGRG